MLPYHARDVPRCRKTTATARPPVGRWSWADVNAGSEKMRRRGSARSGPSQKPTRCLAVGLGRQMHEVYLPALRLTDRIQIVGAVDLNGDKEDLASAFGIEHFTTDLSGALAEFRPDFVLLTLPH